ncbi:MAG: LamG domain-containing protein [Planctomycetota bacterium]
MNLGVHAQRSVAFWFRVDDASLTSRKQVVYEEGGTTRGLVVYVFDNQLYVGGWNTPSSESNWAGTWLNTTGIESGRWHHAALTLDGQATTTPTALSGYLDGQRFAQGVGSQLWSRSGSITIGDHSDGTRFHDGNVGTLVAGFAGQLDDGRIYNRVLQANEIKLLARGPAETIARVAAAPPRLAVHEMRYTLAPTAGIDTAPPPPPSRLNAEQTPDFPGLAFTPMPSALIERGATTATELPDAEMIDLGDAMSPPMALWHQISAWLGELSDAPPQPQEVADVDPDAESMR